MIFRSNLQESGIYCFSFGLPIKTCDLESSFLVFFTCSFIGWNFAWLYDIVQVFKHPMHTTEEFMAFYRYLIYLTAILVVGLCYSFKEYVYAPV